jgi:hypothetical protein
MNWFVNKLGPSPTAQRNAANGASRTAAPAQKGATAQKNAPAPKASAQRAAPAPAPEPDKKKKKGWF